MKKLLALLLILSSANFISATDTLRVYTWDEALAAEPSEVLAISLQKMKLDSIPHALTRFKNLKQLDVSKNKLTSLPDFMDQFPQLEVLDLGKNKLSTFPVQICQLGNLRRLIVNRNFFGTLPECVQYLKKLEYIDFWDTPISDLPEAFTLMPQLKKIDLSGIKFNPAFQKKWRERLPWVRIEFDAPCDCMK